MSSDAPVSDVATNRGGRPGLVKDLVNALTRRSGPPLSTVNAGQRIDNHARASAEPGHAAEVDQDGPGRAPHRRSGFPSKASAERELTQVLTTVMSGRDAHDDRQTLADYLPRWLEGKIEANELGQGGLRPTTAIAYRQHIEDHLIPALGHLRLQDLRPGHVQGLVRFLARPGPNGHRRAPATVRRIHATLRSALTSAVK